MFWFSILLLSVAANIIVGLLVLLKNSRSITSRIFFALTLGLAGWSAVSYISTNVDSNQLFWIRLTMFFVIFMNTAFFFLVQVFPRSSHRFSRRLKYFGLFCILALLVALSPLLFTSLVITPSGDLNPQPGPGMLIFLIHVVVSVIGGPIYLARRYRHSKGIEKMQLRYFLYATLLMFSLLPITNFIVPIALGYSGLIPLSPLYTVVFAGLIAFAIIRHRLFDIRAAVAKAVAYLLTIAVLSLIYASLVFGVSSLLFNFEQITLEVQLVYTLMAVLLAYTLYPIKHFFDRTTNRFFFRDAYDPQVFLDQLNQAIVNNIELGILARHSLKVIADNLKSEYAVLGIKNSKDGSLRFFGTETLRFVDQDIAHIQQSLDKMSGRILVADSVDSPSLKKALSRNNIAIMVDLITKYSTDNKNAIAHLILGPKKSGNIYNKQDIQIIDIIADELVIAIQNALRFEEIEEFNVTLQSKINHATAKLQKTNEKLKELDETKDEFISMASHQLRTPLTSVKGYLSMVLDGDAGNLNDMQKKLLNQAFVSSQRMVYLIADLLNVSRLKTGKFVIEASSTNLADVVESEIAQLKEVAKGKKLTLIYKKPQKFPTLKLDETKTRQVIMNFVDNAIYYTPGGGEVTVELKHDRRHVYFLVKDDGIGIPKEEQDLLFTKFYRASNARKARPDGTGLGLFMAKRVITAQNGTILFESKEGEGSTFGFKFKLPKLDKSKLRS